MSKSLGAYFFGLEHNVKSQGDVFLGLWRLCLPREGYHQSSSYLGSKNLVEFRVRMSEKAPGSTPTCRLTTCRRDWSIREYKSARPSV